MPNPSSNWQPLSLHLKVKYEQGYRYLDRCGEFMTRAENEFGFLCEDATPTGAKMEQPEDGINLQVDANVLVMQQQLFDGNVAPFLEAANSMSSLVQELFEPSGISSSGVAAKYSCGFATEEKVYRASLQNRSELIDDLADSLGLNPLHQSLSFTFSSGSYVLQVNRKPIAFSTARSGSLQTYGFGSTEAERRRIDRRNKRIASLNPPSGYALLLEVDLKERNPPMDGLPTQFATLRKYLAELTNPTRLSL